MLAVDDHSTNRTLLARQIVALGLRVQTAVDGREALAIWQSSEPGAIALVVTDCNMPQLDGYALSRAIREIEVTGRAATDARHCLDRECAPRRGGVMSRRGDGRYSDQAGRPGRIEEDPVQMAAVRRARTAGT